MFFGTSASFLGQDKETPGAGKFSGAQSFVGEMSGVQIWDYSMAKESIRLISDPCISTLVAGNVLRWPPDMDRMGSVREAAGSACQNNGET